MHVVVVFHNVGGYHAARLQATHAACKQKGWRLTAIQVTDSTQEHPWGDLEKQLPFELRTLLPVASTNANHKPEVAAAALPAELDALQPDVVAIPGWGFPVSRTALSWCKRHRALTILMSESKHDDEPRVWWKELAKSLLYVRKFDAALVGGELHREYLVKLGAPRERIFLGYDVVDNDYFSCQSETARRDPAATRLRQPLIPTKPYFIAATRFIKRKNVACLIEAFADYRSEIGNSAAAWDIVICGNGKEEPALRQIIDTRNLGDAVHLPGFVTYQAIGDWYGLANAFVHPALQEQWGLVVNEACAAGLPILCSRPVGACYEIVQDQRNGFVFDPQRRADLTRALIAMHRLSFDARRAMGACSRKIIANFAPQKFAEGLIAGITAAAAEEVTKRSLGTKKINVEVGSQTRS